MSLISTKNRRRQSFRNAPTFVQSRSNGSAFQSGSLSPHADWKSNSVVCHKSVFSGISSLLKPSGPTAVSRLVVAIIVWISIQCVNWTWARSHIGQEVGKSVFAQPTLAKPNAAASVVFVCRIVRIAASSPDVLPYSMFLGVTQSMSPSPCCGFLNTNATATLRRSFQEHLRQ